MPADAVPEWRLVDRLTRSREHAALSTTQLADRLGVSERTVRNWERGATSIRRPAVIAWSHATGVDLDWLTGNDSI